LDNRHFFQEGQWEASRDDDKCQHTPHTLNAGYEMSCF